MTAIVAVPGPAPTPLLVSQPVTRSAALADRNMMLAIPAPAAILAVPTAQGPAGPPGPAGTQTGFGLVHFFPPATQSPLVVQPNARTQVAFNADPTGTQDFLNAPFAGHLFWAQNKIAPRAADDLLEIIVNLIAAPQVSGGQILLDIDVGSPSGPTGSDSKPLFGSAGTPTRASLRVVIQVLANFMANGAALYLTTTVPVSIVSMSVIVLPRSIYPSAAP